MSSLERVAPAPDTAVPRKITRSVAVGRLTGSTTPKSAWALAAIGLLAACLLGQASPPRTRQSIEPADSADVTRSIARGVAWIWPLSNGPLVPHGEVDSYREAAVLVESLRLHAQGLERGGRQYPLALPVGVRIVPVVHVEAAADAPADLSSAQSDAIVEAVIRQAKIATMGTRLVQLDFEAPARERAAYTRLIAAVRAALPPNVRLSVTVLAHWCAQGDWLDRLPVDEVVPMLYRLGPHADEWRRRFAEGDVGMARRCRGPSLGFATDEPPSRLMLERTARPYWFDESNWSNSSHPPPSLSP